MLRIDITGGSHHSKYPPNSGGFSALIGLRFTSKTAAVDVGPAVSFCVGFERDAVPVWLLPGERPPSERAIGRSWRFCFVLIQFLR